MLPIVRTKNKNGVSSGMTKPANCRMSDSSTTNEPLYLGLPKSKQSSWKPTKAYILAGVKVEQKTGCWLWQKGLNRPNGYGYAVEGLAHRIAYELWNGSIAPGQHVRHTCDTPACCNPAHLIAGTVADNQRDCALKGRYGKRAKITNEIAIEIRRECATGRSYREIAAERGLSIAGVSRIVTGSRWAHVPGATRKDTAMKTLGDIRKDKIRHGVWNGPFRQGQIAEMLKLPQSTVCEIEQGIIPIPDIHMAPICRLYGVTPEEATQMCSSRRKAFRRRSAQRRSDTTASMFEK